MLMSGGVMSTIQLYETGLGSTFPALSTARTTTVWLPSGVFSVSLTGQGWNPAPSRSQSKWSIPEDGAGSVADQSKVGVVSFEYCGGVESKAVSGACVSTKK